MDANEVQERMVEAAPVESTGFAVVVKPFSSEYRRHHVGDQIARTDLDGSHLNFDHLMERGFIEKAKAE